MKLSNESRFIIKLKTGFDNGTNKISGENFIQSGQDSFPICEIQVINARAYNARLSQLHFRNFTQTINLRNRVKL